MIPLSRRHVTKQQFVYETLREAIIRCELPPGERLVIDELARRLDQLRMRDNAHAQASAAPKPAKVGKKEAAERAAIEQRGLYEPPPAPALPH